MKTEIEAAVKALAKKSGESSTQDEAMKYAQAVLNLVNALGVIGNIKS